MTQSLLDFLAPGPVDSAFASMTRADLCSRMAKMVGGHTQKKLYRLKDKNIRFAMVNHPSDLKLSCDRDKYFGLLSVRLMSHGGLRLHTHENWINVA